MSLVSRDHPANEVVLLTAWAKNLATSAVWEATAKRPTSAANAYLSAARAVGSQERVGTIEEPGRAVSSPITAIEWQIVSEEELSVQAALLREIFGNPFRPVILEPLWLTPKVVALAREIYDNRAFDRLPVLADALEEGGCQDADLLTHCQIAGPHVLGCWIVDLLLEKD